MASTAPAAARSATRARAAARRKVTRPPKQRAPEDFFDSDVQQMLKTLFIDRAVRWQQDSLPPILYYPRRSEPSWGKGACKPLPGAQIRSRHRVLCDSLAADLERGLRLLTLTWTVEQRTTEGGHDVEEWRQALAGCLWRIGQLYREFTRRLGAEAALKTLELAMDSLWGVPDERLRRA